ncbi:MAG: PHP-associated domain-containing protein [Promethearchaeota archaeon]
MHKNYGLHQSVSQIPPKNLAKYPIKKQDPISNLFLGRFLKKFGFIQIGTYHLTKKKNRKATFPYMPLKIPKGIYLYDFHAHTNFSDGKGTYKEILTNICRKKILHGLAITDHPWHLGKDKKTRIPDSKVILRSFKFKELVNKFKKRGILDDNFITFPGSCEFFMKLDENHPNSTIELLALGLPQDFLKSDLALKKITNSYALEFIEKVHDNNGIIILPHPFYFVQSFKLLKSKKISRNAQPDAIECYNYTTSFLADESYYDFFRKLPFTKEVTSIGANFGYFNWITSLISYENNFGPSFDFPLARALAKVGTSDAHFQSMIGAASTAVNEPIHSIEDLRRILKNRKTQPIYNPLWKQSTKKIEVYREIWEEYGELIKKGLKETPFYKWIISKVFVDLLSFLFN